MKEFGLQDDEVLVKGGILDAFLDAFGAYRSRGEKVIARHLGESGLEIRPDAEYPCRKVLEGFRELQEQFGPGFLHRVGQYIYERAQFPPALDTFESVLEAMDDAYHMNHVNADAKIGHYRFTKEGTSAGRVVCDNPYPCAFDMGIFAGVAKQFGVQAKIIHEDQEVCRHEGADRCTYRIEW